MKILILSFPFCGASALAASLAHTLGYKYFQDPLSLDRPINITHPNKDFVQTIPRGHNLEYNGWDKETGFHEYVHPNEVEDNTIITHNVLWHKLPSNQNEATFLSHFRAKFDHIICLGSTNVEINWKSHCASLEAVKENNYFWKKWALEHNHYNTYTDSMLNEDLRDKHIAAHTFLSNYIIDTGTPSINREELYGIEVNAEIPLTSAILDKLQLTDLPAYDWDNEKESVTMPLILSTLRDDYTQGNKY